MVHHPHLSPLCTRGQRIVPRKQKWYPHNLDVFPLIQQPALSLVSCKLSHVVYSYESAHHTCIAGIPVYIEFSIDKQIHAAIA